MAKCPRQTSDQAKAGNMNKNDKKVLPFPTRPKQSEAGTITCHIGDEHFAIHYFIEDLPPVAPLLHLPPPRKPKRIK